MASRSTQKSSGFTCWWWANASPKQNSRCSIPKLRVAAELYAFSTEPESRELGTGIGNDSRSAGGTKKLSDPLSEEAGVPLLDPHGIAVDPTTHDVLILGQQDVSTKKGAGEEELARRRAARAHRRRRRGQARAALRRSGELSRRRRGNRGEPACAEGVGQPSSPFVSPGGRLYGERSGTRTLGNTSDGRCLRILRTRIPSKGVRSEAEAPLYDGTDRR